ncbi:hypothetical protein BDQ17DRAFT_1434753 [Cyathus striatus]|nr:hypothetical protein BDQ17DRAFT_1434753 [Cyathus striatus]
MVTTRKSSNTAAAAASASQEEAGGAVGVSKAQGKGAKAAKEKKKKGSKKTSIQRLEEDQNADTPQHLTLAEKVLAEENVSIAPPPCTMTNTGSIKQTQTSALGNKDTLNEEETLLPLESQMAVESIKQANTSGTSGNMRSIKKTNSSVSGSKEPSLESQTNISASGCKDTLNEEETLLPLESQVVAGSNKQTNISTSGSKDILNEEKTLLPLESQVIAGSNKQTNISTSGSKDILNEEETLLPLGSQVIAGSNKQTNISASGSKDILNEVPLGFQDILNEEEAPLHLGSQVASGSVKQTNTSVEEETLLPLESQLQDIELGSKKSESESSSESGSSTESGSESVNNVAMDVDNDITPKKAKPILKHGRAPSSPQAKSSDTRSTSKVSRRSISHSSASSTPSEMSTDYLQGASCTVGGFSRGRATGNTYNYGDEEEDPFITTPNIKGDIRLFFKSDASEPDFVITDQEPSSDFYNILETLGNTYSPVAKRNARISIHENGYWSLKGKYLNIYQKKKLISAHWKLSDQKKYFIEVLADGANIEQKSESTGLMVSKPSGSSESNEDIANAMLISHFNIPERLLKKLSKEQDIHATYEKYELIERIWNKHQPDLSTIGAASKSTVEKKQIISFLIAPSTYYSYTNRVFPLLHYYPEMMSWMKREEGIDTNKVWKSKKRILTIY